MGRQAPHHRQIGAAIDPAGDDVPVEHRHARARQRQRQPLFAELQRGLAALSLGDVLEGTEEPHRLAVDPHRFALGAHRERPAAGGDEGQLQVVGRAGLDCGLDRAQQDRPRRRRVELDVRQQFERRARLDLVNPVHLIGPDDLAGLDVELPAADPGQGPHALQQVGGALQGLAVAHAVGDVHVGADDSHRRAERIPLGHDSAAEHPDPVTLPMPHAVLALVERRLPLQVRHDRGIQRRPVVGVHQFAPGRHVVASLLRRQPQQGVLAFVDADSVGRHVQGPQAQVAAAQHDLEHLRAALALGRGLRRQALQRAASQPQFEQRGHLAGQRLQGQKLGRVEAARHGVDDAHRAHRRTPRQHDRCPGVEADVRRPGDERVGMEARVERGIFDHHHRLARSDGVGAEGQVARGFGWCQADLRLEPLTLRIEQRHHADRRAADLRRQRHDVVIDGLGQGVHHLQGVQRLQARRFIGARARG